MDKRWTGIAFKWVFLSNIGAVAILGLVVALAEKKGMDPGGFFCGGLFVVVVATLFYWPLVLASVAGAARLVADETDLGVGRRAFARTAMSLGAGFVFLFFLLGELAAFVLPDDSDTLGFAGRLLGLALYLALTAHVSRIAATAYFDSAYPTDPEPPARERRVQSYFEEPPSPPSPLEPKED